MNPDTGAIAHFEDDADANAAGYTVPLTAAAHHKLRPLNRLERIEEARRMKLAERYAAKAGGNRKQRRAARAAALKAKAVAA